MADVRESFPILEDATGGGLALSKSQLGDVAAGKIGSTAYSFRDVGGNLVLPMLDSEGRLMVTSDAAGVPKKAAAKIAGTATEAVVCEIALTPGKTYGKMSVSASCFKEAIFRVVQLDGTTETELGYLLSGPGCYNGALTLGAAEIVAGAAGTQKLQLKGSNAFAGTSLSDLRGSIAASEFAVS